MAQHRHGAQGAPVGHGLAHARPSPGRYRPPLSLGRDGIGVPRGQQGWQEGAPAPVSGGDRRGKRRGTG